LRQRLPAGEFDVAVESFGVDVGASYRFPDIVIEPAQSEGQALEAKAPILIVEVLSPGTLHVDFGDKRQEYLGLPTLDTYLIVSPDEPRAWVWQRSDNAFPSDPEIIEGLDRQLTLPALGTQIELREVYRGVL
jgi:Uma2 family endonuclease